ncbi:hypothetical protein P3L10_020642 [Capsicum annuum]
MSTHNRLDRMLLPSAHGYCRIQINGSIAILKDSRSWWLVGLYQSYELLKKLQLLQKLGVNRLRERLILVLSFLNL